MGKIEKQDISFLLNEVATALDISDTLYGEAESRYQAVGRWLGEEKSPLADYSPTIYPQGSFLLGTVTRPADDSDDYDIDLVFELVLSKTNITQKDIKQMVGDRLKENEIYRNLLDEEKKRCWRLQYANGAHFHMDILPAIPDDELRLMLKEQGVPQDLAETSIAITDNEGANYDQITSDWPRSNPKGYAAWFRQRMLVQFTEMQKRFAISMKADISKVPEYRIKTPLQRSIQLLKRHRDLLFITDPDCQPASIIITTLAAMAYNNEADITDALCMIVQGMPENIKFIDGVIWIVNPVDPTENFADRWKQHPRCQPNFYKWLSKVAADLKNLLSCKDLNEFEALLQSLFGERATSLAINKYKELHSGQKPSTGVRQPTVVAPPLIKNPLLPWGE